MSSDIKNIIGTAYEHFIMRDLTYVFAGFLILISINLSFNLNLVELFENYFGIMSK